MDYPDFESTLNNALFAGSKKGLIKKIVAHPARYTGLFRPTLPQTKIMQNLLQSHEIRFGDAFEALIGAYIAEEGFTSMKKSVRDDAGKILKFDQIFHNKEDLLFVEQKIRDDHDSSKKEGQIANFEKKINAAIGIKSDTNYGSVYGYFYFIDGDFEKNKKYYTKEIDKLSRKYKKHAVALHLCYGEELFTHLQMDGVWDEILSHLKKWRKGLPELPQIDFDADAEASAEEIQSLSPSVFKKLFSNSELDETLCALFPQGDTLRLLGEHFAKQDRNRAKYRELDKLCAQAAERIARLREAKDNATSRR